MAPDYNHFESRETQCVICRADIKSLKGTYQSPEFHSIACEMCVKQFSSDDIDMMISLFYLYGGYYGQKKDIPFSIESILPIIFNNLEKKEGKIEDLIDEFSKKTFHKALLHGVSPSEYIKSLRSLLE